MTIEDYFDLPVGDDPVNVIIYKHPCWDGALILEDDSYSLSTAMENLSYIDQHRAGEFEIERGTVNRQEFDRLSEFDG